MQETRYLIGNPSVTWIKISAVALNTVYTTRNPLMNLDNLEDVSHAATPLLYDDDILANGQYFNRSCVFPMPL